MSASEIADDDIDIIIEHRAGSDDTALVLAREVKVFREAVEEIRRLCEPPWRRFADSTSSEVMDILDRAGQ